MPKRERTERVHGPYDRGRGKKRWRVVVSRADGGQDAFGFESEVEAQRCADEARKQSEGRTLTIAVDGYEVDMRERGLASTTIDRDRRHLDVLLALETNGHKMLAWLTPKRAAALYTTLRAKQAVDTHRNALRVGRAFGRFAAERGWLTVDPFAKVKGIGKRNRGKPQLTIDETRKLEDACLAERSRESLAVASCFAFGFGASEVVQRRVRDLDDGGRVLWMTKGKNEHRKRSVEVPEYLRAPLLELAANRPGAAYLFGESDIDRPSRYWIHYHAVRLCTIAKVPRVTPHGLRGTHSTIALGQAASSLSVAAALAAVREGLGHAPGSTVTETTYVAPGAVQRAKQRATLRVLAGGRK